MLRLSGFISRIQRAKPEIIIGLGMILIGSMSIIFPQNNIILLYVKNEPTGFRIAATLGTLFIAFGSILFWLGITGRGVTEFEMKLFCSPIMLITGFVLLSFLSNPIAYRYSVLIPVIFLMLAWLIMSFTLNSNREGHGGF